jgi:hypothetical protein
MAPFIGQLLDETQSEPPDPVRVVHARLHDPDPAGGPGLLDLDTNPIVLDLDDQSQDLLVRSAFTMVDGIGDELRDGEARIIDPSIQRLSDPSIQCGPGHARGCLVRRQNDLVSHARPSNVRSLTRYPIR